MAKNLITEKFSEPLHEATTARVDIHTGDGNLTIDRLTGDESVLASGALEYFENRGLPIRTLDTIDDQAIFTLRGSGAGKPWFRLPWSACNGATEWQIHLNPAVSSDVTANTGGGNVKLDLSGMTITRVSADTGGGNLDVVLPDNAANLSILAKTGGGNVTVEIGSGTTGSNIIDAGSGAGNVEVHIPGGLAARIYATTGLGKSVIDPRFAKIDNNTYQSPDFDGAEDRAEITVKSGAGNVSVTTK
jgi:hypothetical protein